MNPRSAVLFAFFLFACVESAEPRAVVHSEPRANSGWAYRKLGPFPTGEHPNEMAVADFDGDGDDDIATAGLVEPALIVLENDGGSFTPVEATPLVAGPVDLEAADLDADGIPELVAATFEDGRVIVSKATPGLDFTPWFEIRLDAEPAYLASGDLDGDGFVDMAVSRFRGPDVIPLYGDGTGALFAGPPVTVSSRPGALAIVDATRDGRLDIVVVTALGNELVLLASQGRDWSIAASAPTSAWPTSVVAGDVDGDGIDELVGATTLGSTLFIAEGASQPMVLVEQPAGLGAFDVALADLDGDGRLDAAVTYKNENRLAIFAGSRDGLLPLMTLETGNGPTPVRARDLNGDGAIDLTVANGFSSDVEIFLADP